MKGGDFVFPQTNSDDPNFNRTGGLTKRELVAALLYVETVQLSSPVIGKDTYTAAAIAAVRLADALLEELGRENARKD